MERRTSETESIFMVHVTVSQPLGKGEGSISAAGFSETDSLELAHTVGEKYVVAVDPNAPACCIDGRCALHTMAGEGTKLPLGPHIAGGALFTAFGAAELVPDYYGSKSDPTALGRLTEIKTALLNAGIKLGAHVSAGAVANGFKSPTTGASQTGCGLNDQFKSVMTMPAREKQYVADTTAVLLGEAFNANDMQFRPKSDVENRVKTYDSKNALDVFVGDEHNYAGVEVLGGEHAEKLVVFNYAEGTTVDRDRLVRETGQQVFVVDMWYIDTLARAMAAGRPDAPKMYSQLKHAMAAFQVATYLALCDGSHRPVIITPEPSTVPAEV